MSWWTQRIQQMKRGSLTYYGWLVFMITPLAEVAGGAYSPLEQFLGAAGGVLFVWLYVASRDAEKTREILPLAAVQLALGELLTFFVSASFSVTFVYVGALLGRLRADRLRVGGFALLVGVIGLTARQLNLGLEFAVAMSVVALAVGVSVRSVVRLLEMNRALRQARDEVARLAKNEERLRIARDLHDTLGHTLSTITLKSEVAGRLAAVDAVRAEQEIQEVAGIARRALEQLRTTVSGYRHLPLTEELPSLKRTLAAAGIRCEVRLPERAPLGLDSRVDTALSLVAREAVTNVVRHSGAGICRIAVERDEEEVRLVVEDDGRGLGDGGAPPRSAGMASPGGYGLFSMRERLAAVDGRIEIGPGKTGSGARILATAPVTQAGGTPRPKEATR